MKKVIDSQDGISIISLKLSIKLLLLYQVSIDIIYKELLKIKIKHKSYFLMSLKITFYFDKNPK